MNLQNTDRINDEEQRLYDFCAENAYNTGARDGPRQWTIGTQIYISSSGSVYLKLPPHGSNTCGWSVLSNKLGDCGWYDVESPYVSELVPSVDDGLGKGMHGKRIKVYEEYCEGNSGW